MAAKTSKQIKGKSIINDAILKDLYDKIHGINYGTVEITVHNAKIVQVEVAQKNRFDDIWLAQGGSGI